MGIGSFPGVKYDRGVMLTTHPLLVPPSWESSAVPLPTLWATTGHESKYSRRSVHNKRCYFSHSLQVQSWSAVFQLPIACMPRGKCCFSVWWVVSVFLIFVVPSIMLYSSEISPTRCNNCVFILRNGFTLHVSSLSFCFLVYRYLISWLMRKCRVKPLRRIKTQLLHLGIISLLWLAYLHVPCNPCLRA